MFDRQIAEQAMMGRCVVERKNMRILTDSSVWFGVTWLVNGRSWIDPAPMGTTKVKNGHAIQTRLFED
jgi:hypothetical protein